MVGCVMQDVSKSCGMLGKVDWGKKWIYKYFIQYLRTTENLLVIFFSSHPCFLFLKQANFPYASVTFLVSSNTLYVWEDILRMALSSNNSAGFPLLCTLYSDDSDMFVLESCLRKICDIS